MEILQKLLDGLSYYRYALAFLLSIVEGPIVMVASGMLLKLNFFYFLPIYLVLMAGDFVADILWYAVGRYGARNFVNRFGKYFSLTPEILEKLENVFKKHHDKILFISKITMGFGFALATLIVAGMVKVDFKRYVIYNLLGGVVWTGLLLSAGYFFGNLYNLLDKGFKVAFIVFLVALISGFLYGGGKYFKQLLLKNKL